MTQPPDTQIVPAEANVVRLPPAPDDLVVLANNPAEMQMAQTQLLAWADRKLEILKAEKLEAQQNLAECKKLKVRTTAWTRQVTLAEGRIVAYEKIRSAIAEGYYIVPNFPVQIIAVRTDAKKPRAMTTWRPPSDITSDSPPLGDGRYVNPQTLNRVKHHEDHSTSYKPIDFRNFDFPFQVVKPKVLSDLDHAMKLKIFDEIGILPAPAGPAKRAVGGDPMLVGIVRRRESSGHVQVMFLISWWIDTRTL